LVGHLVSHLVGHLVGHLIGHLLGHLNCHLVSNLIGWKSGSLFHVHMFLLFTSKVPHFWNFQQILSNIFFVDQPTSPIPFRAADQRIPTSPMVKSATNRRHRWNRPHSADWNTNCVLTMSISFVAFVVHVQSLGSLARSFLWRKSISTLFEVSESSSSSNVLIILP